MKKNFIKETKAELKKVIWPTAKQTTNNTGVVIAMVAIVGIYITLADIGSTWIVETIMTKLPSMLNI